MCFRYKQLNKSIERVFLIIFQLSNHSPPPPIYFFQYMYYKNWIFNTKKFNRRKKLYNELSLWSFSIENYGFDVYGYDQMAL